MECYVSRENDDVRVACGVAVGANAIGVSRKWGRCPEAAEALFRLCSVAVFS